MLRSRACILSLLTTLGAAAPAMAQDDEPTNEVTTSAVLLREGGTTAAHATIVQSGLRLGLRDVEGVSYVHPVDVLSTPPISEELAMGFEELDPLADMVRTGDAREAFRRADELVSLFEQNLAAVPRARLVDVYMISAIGRCRAGMTRECEERVRDIIAFREGLEYDAERYGPESAENFERARSRALSGARGTLVVQTEPEGAEIYIDGRSYGPSPVNADGLLAGQHYVTVKELGFEKLIARADVRAGRDNEAIYTLQENERSRLIVSREAQASIRGELGEPRAGDSIRSLGNTLGTTQVMIGVLRPAAGGQVHVQLYLYHVHTRLLQAQDEATLTMDDAGRERARQLAVALYEGVDLTGGIAAPDDPLLGGDAPIFEQWWFWTAIGGGVLLVVGAITAGVLAAGAPNVPGGFWRAQGDLP